MKKIFSPTCFTISFLLLIYTFYKSEIYWSGSKSDYYLTYYIISSLLIIFSIITFFINQKIKEYLIIFLFSFIISLYLFEGYLTFKKQYYKSQFAKEQLIKQQLYEKKTGKKYDKRTKKEFYEDLIKVNSKIKLLVHPKNYLNLLFEIFPLSGISNSETIQCNENGYYAIYESDRHGFNNPDKEWDSKEIEYLLVGDSYTLGACVNRPNDIASVLRNLSNKSVLNLGYSGNGPLTEYATLREYLRPNIKKILWIYYEGNDFFNLQYELKNKILVKYLSDLTFSQNLKIKQKEIDSLSNILIEKEKNKGKKIFVNKLIDFIKLDYLRGYLNIYLPTKYSPEGQPKPQNEFKKIIQLTKDLASQNNLKLYFIYLPDYHRYKDKYNNSDYFFVKRIINELDITFIDIHKEVFDKEENPLKLFPFELSGHYNVQGFKKTAETIYKLTKD